jgi:uncharacterized protein (DUF305 family)
MVKKHACFLAFLSVLVVSVALWAQQSKRYWSELRASMERMHLAVGSIEPSGSSDVDFVKLMIPHHQAAIDMSKTQLMYGTDPEMRRLAQEIITDQQSEIELMQLWLKRYAREH